MDQDIRRVAVIGLGRMGSGIARNILQAGFELAVYNRSPEKTQPLVAGGATAASSPKEAATGADVVLTSLMDDRSVMAVVEAEEGLLAGMRPGAVHIGTTTVSPACAAELAELHTTHGTDYVAAPVLGRPDAAAAGELRTFVAGDPAVIARCEPLFRAYSHGAINVGPRHEVANSLKLASNYIVASLMELMGHLYAFAEKSGIDLELLNGVITTLLASPAIQAYAERIRTRDFDPAGFELVAGLKDVRLMLDAAAEVRAALPYAATVRDKLLAAIANGLEHKDWSAIYEITRINAGLK